MRHGREFWRRHVEGWRASGLTQRAYCERHGLVKGTLGYWSSKLRAEANDVGKTELVEVARVGAGEQHERHPQRPIELVVEGRYLLRLWAGVSGEHLGEVLEVLEGRR